MEQVPSLPAEPEPRPGCEILDDVERAFRKFTVQQTTHEYVALSLYAAYTHAAGCFDFAPRLLITSAEKRSGKTRTLDILARLVARPLRASNATLPAIFRSITADETRTLILDEADTQFGTTTKAEQNEDLRGFVNAGFQKGTPLLRTVGATHVPTEFPTFSPVVMAAIGKLPTTILDRAVNIRARRRKPDQHISDFRIRRDDPPLVELGEEVSHWVSTILGDLELATPDNPLEDRAADLWEPLLAVADMAEGDWPGRARAAAIHLTREAEQLDDESSPGIELLRDIAQLLDTMIKSEDFIPTSVLLDHLTSMEESRWRDEALSSRRLASLLRPYSITPVHDRSGKVRGYKRYRLVDAFERYLPKKASEPSVPSETLVSSAEKFDGLASSDGLKRKDDNSEVSAFDGSTRQIVQTVRTQTSTTPTDLTDLTGLTGFSGVGVKRHKSCPIHYTQLDQDGGCTQCQTGLAQ